MDLAEVLVSDENHDVDLEKSAEVVEGFVFAAGAAAVVVVAVAAGAAGD